MERRILSLGTAATLLGTLLALGAVAWAAEQLIVIEREAAIRKDKRTYSPRLAAVVEGKKVNVLVREDEWLRVEYAGVEGWMKASAVTDNPDPILSSSEAAQGVRSSEQSAAGRGFNPEVEKEYRKDRPNLDAAFKFLDDLVKEKTPDEKVLEFITKGNLSGGEGGGS